MEFDRDDLATIHHAHWDRIWQTGYYVHYAILYFGDWSVTRNDDGDSYRCSITQYNAFEFSFKGPTVRW